MIQNNIDHPLVKEGLEKLNENDMFKKLKDVDLGKAKRDFDEVAG
jgi:hypothetical protein